MKLCEKKQNNIHVYMYMILSLKVIFDMFYQIQVVDIALTGCAVFLLVYVATQRKIKINICDSCILLLSILFTVNFFKDVTYYRDYVKIMSGFILYFLGRYSFSDVDELSTKIGKAFLVVFIINVIYCILGFGTIKWGEAITYRGTYYFKTDFAAMISYFVVFFFTKKNKFGWKDWMLFLLAGYFTIMANGRIFYLIFSIMIGFILLYRRDQKIVSIKGVITLFICAMIGVLLAVVIPKLPFFAERDMLGFDVDSMSDLFDNRNMQGRNNIWKAVLSAFSKTDIITQLFGAELSFNDKYGLQGFSEHSLYVKLILNSGYVGLITWLLLVASLAYFIWKTPNGKKEYLCSMLMTVFLIEGITVETIAFTDSTWLTMFFCGMVCGLKKQLSLEEKY